MFVKKRPTASVGRPFNNKVIGRAQLHLQQPSKYFHTFGCA